MVTDTSGLAKYLVRTVGVAHQPPVDYGTPVLGSSLEFDAPVGVSGAGSENRIPQIYSADCSVSHYTGGWL
jgi:hypothetical protein